MSARDTIGASAPPRTSVITIVPSTIELAVISAWRETTLGMAAASAGLKSWPNAAEDGRDPHRAQHHRVGRDQRLARDDARNGGRLGGAEELANRSEGERDHQ